MKEVGLHFTGGENLIDRILNQWPLPWVICRSINAQTPEKVYHSSGLSCMPNGFEQHHFSVSTGNKDAFRFEMHGSP